MPPRFPDVQLEDSRPLSDYNSTFHRILHLRGGDYNLTLHLIFHLRCGMQNVVPVIATVTDHAQTRMTSDSVVVKCYLHQVFNLSRKRVMYINNK